MDSPSLAANTPARATSPSPFDDDRQSSHCPSLVDAQISSSAEEVDTPDDSEADLLPPGATMDDHTPRDAIAKLLKGKEKERTFTVKKAPLTLLDLPVDILKEIIQQLPHTNDLTSLALCHSALHRLTIPNIYSRFDIVWPDESTHTEPRTGVDALTYGLATLVMAEESFPHQTRYRQDRARGLPCSPGKQATTPYPIPRRRFGNYYAQYTKKFSLGNGPAAWVQEYMITKEGGKMLGTLVALAVARMINLETFVWDMPTGILRDVWLALSSLADRTDGEDCRLERLWIRWHDNSQLDAPSPVPPPPMILNNVPPPPNTAQHTAQPSGASVVPAPAIIPVPSPSNPASAIDRVEHPTFSVIPPLKSLSVLDIDELPYLDEMSILIARSSKKLRELRVGIAAHAQQREWVTPWDGEGIQQVDYSTTWTTASSIGDQRLGGVLGVLVGRIYNIRQNEDLFRGSNSTDMAEGSAPTNVTKTTVSSVPIVAQTAQHDREPESAAVQSEHLLGESNVQEGVSLLEHDQSQQSEQSEHSRLNMSDSPSSNGIAVPTPDTAAEHFDNEAPEPLLNGKLRLEVLELERVPLSVNVILKAVDWTMLTTLTLLHCLNHEQLWKSLRRAYTPRAAYPAGSPASSKAYRASYTLKTEYSLNIKKIHTNTVSSALISFLKETLAPNSLEVLFLQEGRSYVSTVSVDAIYRGPLRRHRASLRKVMIDSSEKGPDGHATTSSRWKRWMLNREIITFITSGRMTKLRELAVSIDYRDWHFFLQRLPLIPHVRSLYIPFIADHAHGNNIDPRELALQIVDIVHLRPEVEICYIGIYTKCFEILENRPTNYDLRQDSMNGSDAPPGAGYVPHDPQLSDEESEATEDEDEDDMLDSGLGAAGDGEDTDTDTSEEGHDDSDGDDSFLQEEKKGPKFRIREILFYENIEIFSARHGRL